MPIFLFMFGYETPAQHFGNAEGGWDFEDSQAVFIDGPDEAAALGWGREIAEQFVRNLWSADGRSGPSWKEGRFAHGIETDPAAISAAREWGVPRVSIGEHPALRLPE